MTERMCVCVRGTKERRCHSSRKHMVEDVISGAPEDTDTCVSDQQYHQGTCIPGDDTKGY